MTPFSLTLQTVYVYTVFLFTHREGGEEGGVITRDKVTVAINYKVGQKYQHD